MHVLVIPSWYPQKDKEVVGSFFKEQVKVLASAGVEVGVIVPQINPVKMGGGVIFGGAQPKIVRMKKCTAFLYPIFLLLLQSFVNTSQVIWLTRYLKGTSKKMVCRM